MPKFQFPKKQLIKYKYPKLRIADITLDIPIIQGGMGVGISLSGLAAAVSNAGGLGVIAANGIGLLDPGFFTDGREASVRALRKELRKFKELSQGPIGVNIMVAANDFDNLLAVCIEEKVDFVILGAGLPIKNIPVERLRAANVKVLVIVSSQRVTRLIFEYWLKNYQDIPDGVIVEGPLAGGHLGFKLEQIDDPGYCLAKILPQIIETVSHLEKKTGRTIPVIAAGGIYSGEDIYHFLQLGAAGVQMGTRFVATDECDADIKFKEAYVNSKKEDIQIISSPVGMPGRALYGSFFSKVEKDDGSRNFTKCAWKCLKSCDAQHSRYCIALALDFARKGDLEKGFVFAGANAHRVDKIVPVKVLLSSLKEEFQVAVQENTNSLKAEYEKILKRITDIKSEYSHTLENRVVLFKQKYMKELNRQGEALRKECNELVEYISRLKNEYLEYVEKFEILVKQILLISLKKQ